jgi:hypothetical protein
MRRVLGERHPVDRVLDADLRALEERRFQQWRQPHPQAAAGDINDVSRNAAAG